MISLYFYFGEIYCAEHCVYICAGTMLLCLGGSGMVGSWLC